MDNAFMPLLMVIIYFDKSDDATKGLCISIPSGISGKP